MGPDLTAEWSPVCSTLSPTFDSDHLDHVGDEVADG